MKKAIILLSLSILLVSCGPKQEEKVILDKGDQKIIEEVLEINNETETSKTEEEAVEKIEKADENKVEEKKENTVKENNKVEKDNTETKEKTEITAEEEAEADNLLKDLLGGETEIDDALDDVTK